MTLFTGFGIAGSIVDETTGFSSSAYIDGERNLYIAFAGTEDAQDWVANLDFGLPQWQRKAGEFLNSVTDVFRNSTAPNSIVFTGHSLGGALAQYAVYEFEGQRRDDSELAEFVRGVDISVVTFNALGGLAGESQRTQDSEPLDPEIVSAINGSHFYMQGDFVSMLGDGHIGGRTYEVQNLENGPFWDRPFEFLYGHKLDRFVEAFAAADVQGFAPDVYLRERTPDYIHLDRLPELASQIGTFLNGTETDGAEGKARLVAAVAGIFTLMTLPGGALIAGDVDRVFSAIMRNLRDTSASAEARTIFDRLSETSLSQIIGIVSAADRVGILSAFGGAVTGVALVLALLEDALEVTADFVGVPEQYSSQIGSSIEVALGAVKGALNDSGTPISEVFEHLRGETLPPFLVTPHQNISAGTDARLQILVTDSDQPWSTVLYARVSDPAAMTLHGEGVLADELDGRYLIEVPVGSDILDITLSFSGSGAGESVTEYVEFSNRFLADIFGSAENRVVARSVVQLLPDFEPPTRIYGTNGDDVLDSGALPVTVDGLDGNDVIFAGPGDRVFGGVGDDFLIFARIADGGPGRDFIEGSPDADALEGNTGNDLLSGVGGNDHLSGEAGDDVLAGGYGTGNTSDHDVLLGGTGNDVLFGDAHILHPDAMPTNWTIVVSSMTGWDRTVVIANAIVTTQELVGDADFLEGGDGDDTLFGGPGDDTMDGGAGADWLAGEPGDDLLDGGAGNDRIFGDALNRDDVVGDDVIYGRAGSDYLVGGPGEDVLYGGADDDVLYGDMLAHRDIGAADDLYGEAGDDELRGGVGADRLFGGSGDDVLVGDEAGDDPAFHGNDYLDGAEGNDILVGGGGDDSLVGGNGNDRLAGDSAVNFELAESAHGNDILYGGRGNDVLQGNGGNDVLEGGEGDDELDGGTGNDTLLGEAGDDLLLGGEGDDRLDGGAGNDLLAGNSGWDRLDGGSGDDGLTGGAGDDELLGGDGADVLEGDDGNDRLDGGTGNDTLAGGEGDDFLLGGAGADVLAGGPGNDVLAGGPGDDVYLLTGGDNTILDTSGMDIARVAATVADGYSVDLTTDGFTLYAGDISLTLPDDAASSLQVISLSDGFATTPRLLRDNAQAPWLRWHSTGDKGTSDTGADDIHRITVDAEITDAGGNDLYLVEAGAQWAVIHDAQGDDTFHLASIPAPSALTVEIHGDDVVLTGAGQQLILADHVFDQNDTIVFADGSREPLATRLAGANHAPVSSVSAINLAADQDIPFLWEPTGLVTDPEGGALSYRLGDTSPRWLAVDSATGVVHGTPGNDDVGDITAQWFAMDAAGAATEVSLFLRVRNANDPPALSQLPPRVRSNAFSEVSWDIPRATVIDPDAGDTLTLELVAAADQPLPDWLNFDRVTLRVTASPGADDIGEHQLTLRVTDAQGASVDVPLSWEVIAPPAAEAVTLIAPMLSSTASTPVYTGTEVRAGGDINGDGLADVLVSAMRKGEWILSEVDPSNDTMAPGRMTSLVTYGQAGNQVQQIDALQMNGSNGLQVVGPWAYIDELDLRSLGDVDGDGFSEFSASRIFDETGRVWLVNGAGVAGRAVVDLLNTADVAVASFDGAGIATYDGPLGETNDAPNAYGPVALVQRRYGGAQGIGDVDGDGFDDFAYVSGTSADESDLVMNIVAGGPWVFASGAPDIDAHIMKTLPGVRSLASAGDFDGNGRIDFLITTTATANQTVWVPDILAFHPGGGLTFATSSVSIVGDINADGFGDLAFTSASSTQTFVFGFDVGTASGAATELGVLTTLASAASVDGVGDFDGDGYDDLVVRTGNAISVVPGSAVPVGSALAFDDLDDSQRLSVPLGNEFVGRVAGLGDTTGDGYGDFAVGLPFHENAGVARVDPPGAVAIIAGGDFHGDAVAQGSTGDDVLSLSGQVIHFAGGGGHDSLILTGGGTRRITFGDGQSEVTLRGLAPDAVNVDIHGDDVIVVVDEALVADVFLSRTGSTSGAIAASELVLPYVPNPGVVHLGIGSLRIDFDNQRGAIHLANFDPQHALDGPRDFERFTFADGSQLTYETLLERGFDINGTADNDTLTGTSVSDRIAGGAGADVLRGNAGDDILTGNAGDDVLEGGEGADRYVVLPGDGRDEITDFGGEDELEINVDALSDLLFTRDEGDLTIGYSVEDSVRINGWFIDDTHRVERVRTNDGAWLTPGDIDALLAAEPANLPPQVTVTLPPLQAIEDRPFFHELPTDLFTDPGDTMTIALRGAGGSALPAWISYEPAKHRLQGLPGDSDPGDFAIEIVATDSGGLSATAATVVHVVNVNDAPRWVQPMGDVSVNAGTVTRISYAPDAVLDADIDDQLSFSVRFNGDDRLPAWLQFAEATLQFSVAADEAYKGNYSIEVVAVDRDGAEAKDSFALEIVSDVPVVTGTNGFDALIGIGTRTRLEALAGNDRLSAGADDHAAVFVGGPGRDSMVGRIQNDLYLFSTGDGGDFIRERGGNADRIVFLDEANLGEVTAENWFGSMLVHYGDDGDWVRVNGWFGSASNRIESIENLYGEVVSAAALEKLTEMLSAAEPGERIALSTVLPPAEFADGTGVFAGPDALTRSTHTYAFTTHAAA
ncbi:MAG: FG-GAP repeat protein [Gammaproteobacteria bacterium]|nr:FG-GAP repeat protein [Gammaproteobacteria bacterium]